MFPLREHIHSTVVQSRRFGRPIAIDAGNCRSVMGLSPKSTMPKPNYSFEKRKREMDKKAKKAEKLRRKDAPADSPAPDAAPGPV